MTDINTPEELKGEPADYELFINGEFVASSSTERLDVAFPYDDTVWATVPAATEGDVETAVNAAREEFKNGAWGDTLPSQRRDILHQISDVVSEHGEELARLTTLENGRLISEQEGKPPAIEQWCRYYAGMCDKIEGEVIPVENKGGQMFNYTKKEPLGVVGGITPWNAPILLTMWKLAPALAAGNTFVHKPSEHSPVSALRFAELISEETDLPDGAYNVIPGGPGTGAALTENEHIDKIAFTGSAKTGRKVGKQAAENILPASLELGGKSPQVIFPSANLENAVNGVSKGVFPATGQMCLAGSRVLVHEDVEDEFVDRLVDRASDIDLGNPLDRKTQMGPAAFHGQWQKIMDYVERGREEGATIKFGGEQPESLPEGSFIKPTVLTDVSNEMQVVQEEIFGPVVSVLPFSSEAEAIELANDTDYGLVAAVWSEDMRQCKRVADELEAGSIFINEYRTLSYASPFGGYKNSGIGRENGKEGLDEYLQTKSIWMDLSGKVADPFKPE